MIPAQVPIFVATAAADMRRGFDGLAAAAREVLGEDPQSGALFLFLRASPRSAMPPATSGTSTASSTSW